MEDAEKRLEFEEKRLEILKMRTTGVVDIDMDDLITEDEITDEDMKNLFERFYRADKAHSDNGHYGLGLAIAKAIVTSHKGSISVKSSDGINTFTVEL